MNVHIKHTIILFVDKLFTLATGFLISILAARKFGPEEFGIFNYAVSLVGIFGFVFSLGLENVVVKKASDAKDNLELSKLATNSTIIKIVSSFIGIVLVYIYCYFFSRETMALSFILGLANSFLFANVIDFIYQGTFNFSTLVRLRLASKILMTIAQLIFLLYILNIYYFAIANIIYNLSYVIFLWVSANNKIKFRIKFVDKVIIYELLKKSLPFTLASIAIPIFMQCDTIMLKHITNNNYETGLYSAVQRILVPASIVGSVLSVSLFALIKKNVSLNNFNELIKIHCVIFYACVISCLIVGFYSENIMVFLYGDKYINAGPILAYSVWIILFSIIGPIGTKLLICIEATNLEFYKTFLAALVNIILNFYFIKEYGALGASISSLFAYFIANILFFALFKKTRFIVRIYTKSLFWRF
ncbi:TPA: flippase [Citrobacter braakii]|uniref:flippase n=1 Tax=Citrobacter braakii TaxID=57706 RepID=UPI003D954943|nr:flippase [Citrobacter braakii]